MGGDHLFLKYPAEPENLALIRRAVTEQAEALGLDRRRAEDLKTAVSEACSNVILHAYPPDAEDRPLEVEMLREGDSLRVHVRDHGTGIRPPEGERPMGLRMGLLVVGALASCFELKSGRDKGTEVLLCFPVDEAV